MTGIKREIERNVMTGSEREIGRDTMTDTVLYIDTERDREGQREKAAANLFSQMRKKKRKKTFGNLFFFI